MQADYGAFMPGDRLKICSSETGPLAGKTFAAKDVFDIAGYPTINGQPTWAKTRPLPDTHAAAVEQLLNAGAAPEGKTVCDEMCYSLAGDNAHYGAPVNPAAPNRAVGGFSSGSASAVAGGLVDFALGTDCGGSVRCPASFSAIYGIRPTHGRVDDTGVAPLAGSFDVVGWFARDPSLLETVGGVLLQGGATSIVPIQAIVAEDAFARLRHRERAAADTAAANLIGRLGLETQYLDLAPEGLDRWFAAFRHLQALEMWENHAERVTENDPELGRGVKERFAYAATMTEAHRKEHQPVRDNARNRMDDLLEDSRTILVLPTAPVSPKRDASHAEVEDFRARTMGLTCPAGLSGCPQISLPLATVSAPVGISMVGPRGSDETLLRLAAGILT